MAAAIWRLKRWSMHIQLYLTQTLSYVHLRQNPMQRSKNTMQTITTNRAHCCYQVGVRDLSLSRQG